MTNDRPGRLLRQQDLVEIVFGVLRGYWARPNGTCVEFNGGQNVR